tara:strand:+ start:3923 stop:5032 length:1110 start_codon:yes stop_codon:yes gene_type:complete
MKKIFNNTYQNKKVLVTGNTGFKGAWLTAWLLKLNAKVYGISNDIPTKPSMFEELKIIKRIKHFNCDIRELTKVKKIIENTRPDYIFHLAAQPLVSISYKDPFDTFSTNVLGTASILEAVRLLNHKCTLILITSDKCYDNVEWSWGYRETDTLGGKDIYSGSKGAAELVFKSYFHSFFSKSDSKINCVSVRAGNVIGGGDWAEDRIVPDCMRSWSESKPVIIRNPYATRPWQHVLEPLSGYLRLGQILNQNKEVNGESYNFGPPANQNINVKTILTDLSKNWGFVDGFEAYKIINKTKFHEAGLLKLNCDKALAHLGWVATLDYDQLINFTTSWYYKFYKQTEDMYEYTLEQINEYQKLAAMQSSEWIT